ncbi:MAG: tRNA lysidine(34) synthetase TilS [Candidatus Nanopelagicaceae bacterium]|jgi:tRNA(Ile)-lysidine synthase
MSITTPALLELRKAVRVWFERIEPNSKVCIGVSGGADSLALAAASKLEAENFAIDLIAVVVDHKLQENSEKIAQFAKQQLITLGYKDVFIGQANVQITDGLEASARRARYKVFQQAIETYGATSFLLGHTKNDQAEGVLLGLARGSGTKSLSGMQEVSGIFIRPLLTIDRLTTEAACREVGIDFWVDPHNSDQEFARVRVRENILPLLENEIGPGITDALARSAKLLREDAIALDQWAEEVFGKIEPSSIEISLLTDLPIAIRSRILRLAIYAMGAPAGSISAAHIEPIEALVSDWRGQGHTALPGGVKVSRISGRLSLSRTDRNEP